MRGDRYCLTVIERLEIEERLSRNEGVISECVFAGKILDRSLHGAHIVPLFRIQSRRET